MNGKWSFGTDFCYFCSINLECSFGKPFASTILHLEAVLISAYHAFLPNDHERTGLTDLQLCFLKDDLHHDLLYRFLSLVEPIF